MMLATVGATALSVVVIGGVALPWAADGALTGIRGTARQMPKYGFVAACPAPATSAGTQHVSRGDVVVTAPVVKPVAKSGVIVEPSGQTIFYAGPAPKPVDSASLKAKAASRPASSTAVVSAGGEVATRPATPTPPRPATSAKSAARVWTVQVASFESMDEAQTLEQSLCQRGYDARIIGSSRPPFTVQVGAYPSSDSAMVVARHLTSRELTVFVTQAKR